MSADPIMKLVCRPKVWISIPEQAKHYSTDLNLHVLDQIGGVVEQFELMCESIDDDIQTVEGSGATTLHHIQQIESGAETLIEADGNAWVTHITREKVWFEGLYSQGEGGAVSLAQYKLAVQTYVRFLADRERKPIEVEFPE
jgi:hypothetical protein